jgi:hypothetical protein
VRKEPWLPAVRSIAWLDGWWQQLKLKNLQCLPSNKAVAGSAGAIAKIDDRKVHFIADNLRSGRKLFGPPADALNHGALRSGFFLGRGLVAAVDQIDEPASLPIK